MALLKNWQFVFPTGMSKKDIRKIAETFAEFSQSGKVGEYATGKMFNITGKIFGHPSIADGKVVSTSDITAIGRDEKEEKKDIFSGNYSLEEVADYFESDPVYAKTENGSIYYLSKEISANMMLFIGAAMHTC